MQPYSSHPRATVFYHLINVLSSKSCPIGLLWKISEIIENIFSSIFVLRKIWYFRQLWKIKKIWYLRWAFLRKYCFSCSVFLLHKNRSSRPEVFCEKVVLKNFTKFTGKHLCQVPGLDLHRRFPVNFVKFLRAPFSIKHILWLLL